MDKNDQSEFAMNLWASRRNCYLSTDRLAQLAPEVSPGKEAVIKITEQQARQNRLQNIARTRHMTLLDLVVSFLNLMWIIMIGMGKDT